MRQLPSDYPTEPASVPLAHSWSYDLGSNSRWGMLAWRVGWWVITGSSCGRGPVSVSDLDPKSASRCVAPGSRLEGRGSAVSLSR